MLHVLLCVNDLLRNSPEECDKELDQIHEVTVLGESNLKERETGVLTVTITFISMFV